MKVQPKRRTVSVAVMALACKLLYPSLLFFTFYNVSEFVFFKSEN